MKKDFKRTKRPKFLPMSFDVKGGDFKNLEYIKEIAELLYKNHNRLFDDFADWREENKTQKTIELIEEYSSSFWAILDPQTQELAGIAYLYNWKGNGEYNFSAYVSTCFKRKYWGSFAHRAGKLFIKHVCRKFRLISVRAEIFSTNVLARRLLASLGFVYCGSSVFKTLVNGKIVDTNSYMTSRLSQIKL